jgi:hypothetical protein
MSDIAPEQQPCRRCGRPRGENIAEGTRCAACGRREAIQLCLAAAICAAGLALGAGAGLQRALLAALVAAASLTPAFVATVLLHELTHMVTAMLLGQTVVRVIVGEGRVLVRFGRQPQIVIGRVVVGNGATWVLDVERAGYRWRTCVTLLTAPVVSLVVATAAWYASAGLEVAARSATLTFAACNLAMAVITLLPAPTFGGLVWSDLASALFVLRASETDIAEQMAGAVRNAIAVHIERGELEGAITVARAGARVAPESPLAHSLLAFALHTAGRHTEAGAVAEAALVGVMSEADRAYLLRFCPPGLESWVDTTSSTGCADVVSGPRGMRNTR